MGPLNYLMNAHPARHGFTLVEVMVATAVGMYITGSAFFCISMANKAVNRCYVMADRRSNLEMMLNWSMTYKSNSTLGELPILTSGTRKTTIVIGGLQQFRAASDLYNLYANQHYQIGYVFKSVSPISSIGGNSKVITTTNALDTFTGQRAMLYAQGDSTYQTISVLGQNSTSVNSQTQFTIYTANKSTPSTDITSWRFGSVDQFFMPVGANRVGIYEGE